MAYYDALIAAWNSATQPPVGVTGTALTGLSTAAKLLAIDAWTVTGSVPTSFTVTGAQIGSCIVWSELAALTAPQRLEVLTLCNNPGPLPGGSANVTMLAAGMILAYFGAGSQTVAKLTAMAKGVVQPWWQANGYTSPIDANNLVAAGNLQ